MGWHLMKRAIPTHFVRSHAMSFIRECERNRKEMKKVRKIMSFQDKEMTSRQTKNGDEWRGFPWKINRVGLGFVWG